MSRIPLLGLILLGACLPKVEMPCTKPVPSTVWTSLNQTQLQQDIAAIDDYLNTNSIGATKDPSGLRYIITQAGTGDTVPCLESAVSVTYKGMLMSTGAIFDSSTTAVQFNLNQLIAGWQISFLNLNRGSKATLYIPSGLAYGSRVVGSIPANSNLIFEVELLGF